MSESERKPVLEEYNLEPHLNRVRFDRLFEMTEKLCLDEPVATVEQNTLNDDLNARLVRKNGALALRTALELYDGREKWQGFTDTDQYDTDKTLILDSPLRLPEAMYDKTDSEILARIEAFGAQIISESFELLGPEAGRYVELFQQDDHDSQIEAITWLNSKLKEVLRRSSTPDEDNEPDDVSAYYPYRISPKLLKKYPDDIQPT